MRSQLIGCLLIAGLATAAPCQAQEVEAPSEMTGKPVVAEERIDGYRILAIGAGAAAGAAFTHVALGAYVAPWVARSGLVAAEGLAGDYLVARGAAIIGGGAAGGFLGNWLYRWK